MEKITKQIFLSLKKLNQKENNMIFNIETITKQEEGLNQINLIADKINKILKEYEHAENEKDIIKQLSKLYVELCLYTKYLEGFDEFFIRACFTKYYDLHREEIDKQRDERDDV